MVSGSPLIVISIDAVVGRISILKGTPRAVVLLSVSMAPLNRSGGVFRYCVPSFAGESGVRARYAPSSRSPGCSVGSRRLLSLLLPHAMQWRGWEEGQSSEMVSPGVPVARLISRCWSSNTNSSISWIASLPASEVLWKLNFISLLPGRLSLQQPVTVRKSTASNNSNRCCNRHKEEPGYVCLFPFIFIQLLINVSAVLPTRSVRKWLYARIGL